MRDVAPASVQASINRALWMRFHRGCAACASGRPDKRQSSAPCDGEADDDDRDSMAIVGAEIAADFPDVTVTEEAVGTASGGTVPLHDGWQTAYARVLSWLADRVTPEQRSIA